MLDYRETYAVWSGLSPKVSLPWLRHALLIRPNNQANQKINLLLRVVITHGLRSSGGPV